MLWFVRRYALRYKWWYLTGVVALIVTNAVSVAIPRYLQRALASVDPDSGDGLLGTWVAWMVGLAVALVIVRTASRLLIFVPGRESEMQLRVDYFRRVLSYQPPFFRSTTTGDLMSRGTNDIQFVRALAGYAALQMFNLAVALPLNLWMMKEISVSLTIGCLIPLALAGIVMRKGVHIMMSCIRELLKETALLSSEILEGYHGVQVVRDYDARAALQARFDTRNERYMALVSKVALVRSFLLPVVYVVGNLGVLILLYWGGKEVASGTMHFGAVSAFAVYVSNIVAALVSLGWVLSVLQRGTLSLSRIMEVIERQNLNPSPTKVIPDAPPSIRVENLTFSYDDDRDPILDGVSFAVDTGQTLGIFGTTGSGKTTLLRLLTRLEMPPPNTIFINDVDIGTVDLEALRDRVAVVPQSPYLLSRALGENISFGRPDSPVNEDRLAEVVRLACLHEEIERFQDGLDTVVGERGVILSGGQRQRATLARALYRQAPVLILDDTLASVDHDTEQRLIATILDPDADRICVIVSHRMSVLSKVDQILVLDDGRVVETGAHADLVQSGGLYSQAWRAHMTLGGSND